jgi:predicted transcriptional regulator
MPYLTSAMKQVEVEKGKPIADVLRELFEQHGSQRAVAKVLGVDPGTVSQWLIYLGLEQRAVLVRREEQES